MNFLFEQRLNETFLKGLFRTSNHNRGILRSELIQKKICKNRMKISFWAFYFTFHFESSCQACMVPFIGFDCSFHLEWIHEMDKSNCYIQRNIVVNPIQALYFLYGIYDEISLYFEISSFDRNVWKSDLFSSISP